MISLRFRLLFPLALFEIFLHKLAVFCEVASELCFVVAELLFTVGAGERGVSILGKSLGAEAERDLPDDHE